MAAARSSPAPSAADPLARSHVRDFMQLGLSHCDPDDDLSAVARTMAEQRVSASRLRTDLREEVDALGDRLARVMAAATTLRALAADARRGVRQDALIGLLDQLERDLRLAMREAEQLRDRAMWDSGRRVDDG